jgi:hypothetical protein
MDGTESRCVECGIHRLDALDFDGDPVGPFTSEVHEREANDLTLLFGWTFNLDFVADSKVAFEKGAAKYRAREAGSFDQRLRHLGCGLDLHMELARSLNELAFPYLGFGSCQNEGQRCSRNREGSRRGIDWV